MFLQCVSTVIIVYIIISPLNSYLYIHWTLDFKLILLFYYYKSNHSITGTGRPTLSYSAIPSYNQS